MAHLTLAANTGNGTTSYQTVSSRTATDSSGGTTSYVTYEISATAADGWTFSHWEYRYTQTGQWSTDTTPWISGQDWTRLYIGNPGTVEWQHEADVEYGVLGTYHSEREYEVRAVFVQATYSVSVQVSSDSPANSGSVTGGGNGYGYNSSCTVTAFPNSGFIFKKWTTTDSAQAVAVSESASYTFAVTGNVTLYAHFMSATGKLLHGSSGTLLHGSSGTLLYDG